MILNRVFLKIPEPYYLLAEMNIKKGDIDLAKQYLGQYCELAPEDYQARLKLDSISSKRPSAIVVIKDGKEDLTFVKRIGFYGGWVRSRQKDSIKLINGISRSWSSMGVDFAYPQLMLRPGDTLSSDWQQIKVVLDGYRSEIDLSSIVHMGVEFGTSTIQNPANSTLFIEDIVEDTFN